MTVAAPAANRAFTRVPLGELIDIGGSLVDPRVEPFASLPHIAPDSIGSGTGRLFDLASARALRLTSGKYAFEKGDVLYSKIRPYLNKVARAPSRGTCSADMYVLRGRSRWLLNDYLFCVLQSTDFLSQAASYSNRTGIPKLNREQLCSIVIPLPPLAEQRRIADILDRADGLRVKRQKVIAKMAGLTRAVFLDMFGHVRPSQGPNVSSVADSSRGGIRTGPFGSQLLHSEFVAEGIVVLGIDNAVGNEFKWGKPRFITADKYRSLQRYTVHPGDVLITIMGSCGRVAIVPDDIPTAINTKHLCCISLDRTECLPEYLWAYFLYHPVAADYLTRAAKGAVMDGLNMQIIRDLPLMLPSIEGQRDFADRKTVIDKQVRTHTASVARFDALFASLQHRGFRGEL